MGIHVSSDSGVFWSRFIQNIELSFVCEGGWHTTVVPINAYVVFQWEFFILTWLNHADKQQTVEFLWLCFLLLTWQIYLAAFFDYQPTSIHNVCTW